MLEFVETPLFTRLVERYLSDDGYVELQNYLAEHPEAGDVVRGSGGVRKLRWAMQGQGKRGGMRVIYYLKLTENRIWMLTLYAKNVRETIPTHALKQIKEAIDDE